MTEPKLCCNCIWYKKNWVERLISGGDRFDKCLCPVFGKNLVTGKNYAGIYCDTARDYEVYCGENGKYWMERE